MNLELLKKEVLQTICQYIDATQPENLNYDYCLYNNLQAGICCYSNYNDLHYLSKCIFKFSMNNCKYMFTTPFQVQYKKKYYEFETKDLNFIDCHNVRLKYLTKILQEIIFIESEKQKGNIYTYYKLIELFKF
jgi:hypothetical protein